MSLEACLECLKKWRLWIRPLVMLLYALAILVFVPIFLVKSFNAGFNKHDQEILIAGIFVWVTIPVSLWEIIQHVVHYTQPRLQKHVIRILWMVPIYAINAVSYCIVPLPHYMHCSKTLYIHIMNFCYEYRILRINFVFCVAINEVHV